MAVIARFTKAHIDANVERQQAIIDSRLNNNLLGMTSAEKVATVAARKRAPAKKKES